MESNPTLIDVTLNDNTSSEHGGGIFAENSSPPLINGIISGNSSGSGGGIHLDGCTSILTNVIITENFTVESNSYIKGGGGMFLVMGNDVTMNNVMITDNSSHTNGGGISKYASLDLLMKNVTIFLIVVDVHFKIWIICSKYQQKKCKLRIFLKELGNLIMYFACQ